MTPRLAATAITIALGVLLSPSTNGLTTPSPLSRFSSHRLAVTGAADKRRRSRGGVVTKAALEVIEPSYDLAVAFLAISTAFIPGEAGSLAAGENPKAAKIVAVAAGLPIFLFGAFLAFQTNTLRFTFDEEAFSLVKSDLESTGENVVVGGENRWSYKSFVNYDVFPNKEYPILVYFKETQTPREFWNMPPGDKANSPEALAKGAVEGQVHFFPAIGNVDATVAGFESHGCKKLP